jgi:hypothetical protein
MWHISVKGKQHALFAGTSLLVAFVRNRLQHEKGWVSLEDFVFSWLIHYFVLMLVLTFSVAMIKRYSEFFLGSDLTRREAEMNELMVYAAIAIFISAAFILFLGAWRSSDLDFI